MFMALNAKQHQETADPRTKPSNLDCDSTITYTHHSDGQLTNFL